MHFFLVTRISKFYYTKPKNINLINIKNKQEKNTEKNRISKNVFMHFHVGLKKIHLHWEIN